MSTSNVVLTQNAEDILPLTFHMNTRRLDPLKKVLGILVYNYNYKIRLNLTELIDLGRIL